MGKWTLVVLLLLLIQTGLQVLVILTESTSNALPTLIASAGASIFALHHLGQLCRWTAADLHDHEQLPTAVLRR